MVLDTLRTRVTEEADLGDEYCDLRMKIANKKSELSNLVNSLEQLKFELEVANNKWARLVDFFSSSSTADLGSIVLGVHTPLLVDDDELYDPDNDDYDKPEPFEGKCFSEF